MKKKIAITTTSFAKFDDSPFRLLKDSGFHYETNSSGRKMEEKEILDLCKDCTGIIAGTETYSGDLLKKLKGLKVISRCGVGIDNIALETARELGILVVNTPSGPTEAVSELCVGLILNLLRNISAMDRDIRNGIWKKHMGNLLRGKKVGIIGFGKIGRMVAEMLSPFKVELAYNDLKDFDSHWTYRNKDELLSWADIVTLHCSGGCVKKLIGEEEINRMKKGSFFVNLSRGEHVDEAALYHALKSGHLAGAAIDVFEKEPYLGNLKELSNVILTPHIGSYAKESRIMMEIESVNNLINALRG